MQSWRSAAEAAACKSGRGLQKRPVGCQQKTKGGRRNHRGCLLSSNKGVAPLPPTPRGPRDLEVPEPTKNHKKINENTMHGNRDPKCKKVCTWLGNGSQNNDICKPEYEFSTKRSICDSLAPMQSKAGSLCPFLTHFLRTFCLGTPP